MAHLNSRYWAFTFSNFLNLPNQFLESFRTIWFSYSQPSRLISHSLPSRSWMDPLHFVFTWNINDDVQAIIVDMVHGWIRGVNQNFSRASHRERLGESYTWCSVLLEIKLWNSWNQFCEVVNMDDNSWNYSQHVVELVESSN